METSASRPMLYFAVSEPLPSPLNTKMPAGASWRYGSHKVRNLNHALEFLSAFKSLNWLIHQAWVIDTDGFKLTIPPEHIDERLVNQVNNLPDFQDNISNIVFHTLY
ncbi:hypothetical protein [Spirosoma knui]